MPAPDVNVSEIMELIAHLNAQLTVCNDELIELKKTEVRIKKEYESVWSEDMAKAFRIPYVDRSKEEKKAVGLQLYTQLQMANHPVFDKEQEISRLKLLVAYHERLLVIASEPESRLWVFDQDGHNWLGFNPSGFTRDGRHQSTFGLDGYDIYDDNQVDAFNIDIYGCHAVTGERVRCF